MDKPIIFSAPMILALLDGRKTQTRRILKPQPWLSMSKKWNWAPSGKRPICIWWDGPPYIQITDALAMDNVPIAIGDRLWVRESWAHDAVDLETVRQKCEDAMGCSEYGPYFRATETAPETLKWRSPIHMLRWASRLTLEVTGVKVERVQDISEEDVIAEGTISSNFSSSLIADFAVLWNEIHGLDAWEDNPWVYSLTFNVHKCNIDSTAATAMHD